jgi:excisionase family DNA binding protein
MSRLLSPREVADAIGVSESSLKRWADTGRIKVTRTEGGHRRITLAETIRFIRDQRLPVVRPDLLGISVADPDEDDALFRYLVDGAGPEARAWILGRYLAGATVASLCDGPIRAAMTRVGELWQHDPAGVFVEHRATDLCMQALAQLRALFEPPDDGPVAIGGAPTDDPYLLPSWMAATVIAETGMRAINLGPDTPVSALRAAYTHYRPVLVWISATAPVSRPVAAELADWLASLPARTTEVVGGRNAAAFADANDAVTTSSTMAELAAHARAAARPARPARR